MPAVPFQTRARTIDHLGRGQIADCPTAVSELWKNAYDAYASEVALHIFDTGIPIAAVIDDGHGMSREEFVDRWLVVGTEAKFSVSPPPVIDRNGLASRERQGEKGIGRLSVAFLGPSLLVVSKRRGKPFVAALVDWRLFENPYLILQDIQIPVEEFGRPEDFGPLLAGMFATIPQNIDGDTVDLARDTRLRDAWTRYAANPTGAETASAVRSLSDRGDELATALTARGLTTWPVWRGESEHGTALFVLDIHHELSVWVDSTAVQEDSEVQSIKESLRETLSGFIDPYPETSPVFGYQVVVHRGRAEEVVVSPDLRFGLPDLLGLEHSVVGRVDESGVFSGRVRAFGRDLGDVSLPPQRPVPRERGVAVGPFEICVATFEMEPLRSSHTTEVHERLKDKADHFAGLGIYRDSLRVMPYGRAQADFFGIEERRSQHAGRAFWSYRRTFGRVALTRADNPNLRDKAGREGLIDNRAKRELRIIVIDLLKTTANRFFNQESAPYREYLPEIISANQAARAAEQRTVERRKTAFRRALRGQAGSLVSAVEKAEVARTELRELIERSDVGGLVEFEKKLDQVQQERADHRLPPKPSQLGKLEAPYREYRDRYGELCEVAEQITRDWEAAIESLRKRPAEEEARSALARHQTHLVNELKRWEGSVKKLLGDESRRLEAMFADDRGRYYLQANPLVADVAGGRTTLTNALRQMEGIRESLYLDLSQKYGGYIRVLEHLAEGIDLDAALAWGSEQRQELLAQVERLNALAQLGITVEIVGHELETVDAEIDRHLRDFPANVKASEPYRGVITAHQSLTDRLRFLAPIKLSGPRLREDISGDRIAAFVEAFFHRRFEGANVRFVATPAFRSIVVREYLSRVLPVFINLVNNALYWVAFRDERQVRLDRIGEAVVVGDTGPGIDPDDAPFLFQLFFSRRVEGRGVGLYLCRANLAAGGHTIEYARDAAHKVLPGANFVIRFQGVTDAQTSEV